MTDCCDTTALRHDNLTIPQGADLTFQWPLVDANGHALPSVTDYTAKAQARQWPDDVDPLFEWSTENGGIVLAVSVLNLITGNADSSAWDWETAVYDIELTDPYGKVTRLTQGTITVDAEVTR